MSQEFSSLSNQEYVEDSREEELQEQEADITHHQIELSNPIFIKGRDKLKVHNPIFTKGKDKLKLYYLPLIINEDKHFNQTSESLDEILAKNSAKIIIA